MEASKLSPGVRRHPLITQIERGLRRCDVISDQTSKAKGQTRIIVGVSGGADSVALLLGILIISDRTRSGVARDKRLEPIAVHVHHHLRESADDDAAWVQNLCERLGIELHIEHIHPAMLVGNLAANARTLRYEAMKRVVRESGAAHVAVAHHADDQLETMLMALCRGAGLDGLAGMAWSRPLDESTTLIRPLLASVRADCEDFCRVAGLQWRDDPSNADLKKVRARLRRDVIPILEELWPHAAKRASATAELIEAARAALERRLEKSFGPSERRQWDRATLSALPVPIIAAGLRRAALHASPEASDHLGQRQLLQAAEAIRSDDRRPRHFQWVDGMSLKLTSKSVCVSRAPKRKPCHA